MGSKKSLREAKLVISVESEGIHSGKIKTVSVFDNRTQQYWTEEQVKERGIVWFLSIEDMKQTLNWNLNGDDSKYQFKWGKTANGISEGKAYVFH